MGDHYKLEDTQPLDIHDLPTSFWEPEPLDWATSGWPTGVAWSMVPDRYHPDPILVKVRTPEPALVRGLLMAVGGLAVIIAFDQFLHSLSGPIFKLYVGVAPLLLAWWIRSVVTPARLKKGDEL